MFPLPLPRWASPAVSLPLRLGLSITDIYSVLPPPCTAQAQGYLPLSSQFQGYHGNLRAGAWGPALLM